MSLRSKVLAFKVFHFLPLQNLTRNLDYRQIVKPKIPMSGDMECPRICMYDSHILECFIESLKMFFWFLLCLFVCLFYPV